MVYRSWCPANDKAIKVAKFNLNYNRKRNEKFFLPTLQLTKTANYRQNISQKPLVDIATSVNLGDGEYANRDKFKGRGHFRHIRSDITLR